MRGALHPLLTNTWSSSVRLAGNFAERSHCLRVVQLVLTSAVLVDREEKCNVAPSVQLMGSGKYNAPGHCCEAGWMQATAARALELGWWVLGAPLELCAHFLSVPRGC